MPNFENYPEPRPAIHDDPLPQAGDSLRDQQIELLFGKAMTWMVAAIFVALAAFTEWIRFYFPAKPTLISTALLTITALAFIALATRKFRRALRQAHLLKLGIRGEKFVAQYLDQNCRTLGYRVFHDIPCSGPSGPFNIDHALIGPAGIFSIETKNWSLPPKGTKATLRFNPQSNTLHKPDGTFDTTAPSQARANADHLRDLLIRHTSRPKNALPIQPVLMLPGWWIEDPTPRPRPLWILGNDTLHKWLDNEPKRLSPADIALLSEALTIYTRNGAKMDT